jgi:hypothetical protein
MQVMPFGLYMLCFMKRLQVVSCCVGAVIVRFCVFLASDKKRERGNELYKRGEYSRAVDVYNKYVLAYHCKYQLHNAHKTRSGSAT